MYFVIFRVKFRDPTYIQIINIYLKYYNNNDTYVTSFFFFKLSEIYFKCILYQCVEIFNAFCISYEIFAIFRALHFWPGNMEDLVKPGTSKNSHSMDTRSSSRQSSLERYTVKT